MLPLWRSSSLSHPAAAHTCELDNSVEHSTAGKVPGERADFFKADYGHVFDKPDPGRAHESGRNIEEISSTPAINDHQSDGRESEHQKYVLQPSRGSALLLILLLNCTREQKS